VGQWAWKIQFITDRIGYVTTEGPTPEGVVLKTTDGGATWKALSFGTRVNRMRVLSESLVFASGDRVYRWTR